MSNVVTAAVTVCAPLQFPMGNTSFTEAAQLQVALYLWACLSNSLIIGEVVASQPTLLCADSPGKEETRGYNSGEEPMMLSQLRRNEKASWFATHRLAGCLLVYSIHPNSRACSQEEAVLSNRKAIEFCLLVQ